LRSSGAFERLTGADRGWPGVCIFACVRELTRN
jgi:hypothetical protein